MLLRSFVLWPLVHILIAEDCIFDVSLEDSPIITHLNVTFPKSFKFASEEVFYLSCPKGTSNVLIQEDGETVACRGGTNILHLRLIEVLDFTNLKCKPIPVSTVKKLNESCEANGTLVEIGIEVKGELVPEVTVCFNENLLTPFYSKNEYFGGFDTNDNITTYEEMVCGNTTCLFFDGGNMFDVNMDLLYYDQEDIFQNLDIVQPDDVLVSLPMTLGYTAKSLQQIEVSTFYEYTNTVPIWKKKFHNVATSQSFFYNTSELNFIVYTGALGVATALNSANESVEIYLNNGRIPVPMWIWSVAKYNNTDSSNNIPITFVYNSYTTNSQEESESYKICQYPSFLLDTLVECFVEDVVHPDLKAFLKTHILDNN